VANDAYITASEVCDLLKKVAAAYDGKPLYIVLDNASPVKYFFSDKS
jgi:hypothetical protein